MTATTTRPCGCGGHGHSETSASPCGCRDKKPCGCDDQRPPTVAGGCTCEGPVRCGVPCLERPVYSAGQLLTADSLRLGQRYVEERFALRRFVDGVGVVCGLHVRCDPDSPGWVIVDPGYAIGCCGEDLMLCEAVRFNLCKAICECPGEEERCDDVEPPPREEPPAVLDDVKPTNPPRGTEIKGVVIEGTVTDEAGKPLAEVTVKLKNTPHATITDGAGKYGISLPNLSQNTFFMVEARKQGYRPAILKAWVKPSKSTVADFTLKPEEKPAPPAPAEPRTYVLRITGAWTGRDLRPVVGSRPGCDPTPECRPSKEAATVRLCITPLTEATTRDKVEKRTTRFRSLEAELLQSIGDALGSGARYPERAVADALLAFIHDRPLRTSCNLKDLICDLRRLLKGELPRCFGFEDTWTNNPSYGLVHSIGRLLDDLREDYLTLDCDDCCEYAGVRLAHVVTQDVFASCGPKGCSIADIHTHAPSREVLHPRSSWWYPDQVVLYDAYFRGAAEAAVLLTARGLTVTLGDANNSGRTPALDTQVRDWLKDNGGTSALSRLGVYQQSHLYADYSTTVTLWTVGGRVVAITVPVPKGTAAPTLPASAFTAAAYVLRPAAPARVLAGTRPAGTRGGTR